MKVVNNAGQILVLTGGGGGGGGALTVSAAGGSVSNGSIVFANNAFISFGLAGSTITGSHNGITIQTNPAVSGSNGSFSFQTLSFGSSNGLHFYTTNGSIVGSYTVPTVTNSS